LTEIAFYSFELNSLSRLLRLTGIYGCLLLSFLGETWTSAYFFSSLWGKKLLSVIFYNNLAISYLSSWFYCCKWLTTIFSCLSNSFLLVFILFTDNALLLLVRWSLNFRVSISWLVIFKAAFNLLFSVVSLSRSSPLLQRVLILFWRSSMVLFLDLMRVLCCSICNFRVLI